MKHYFKQAFDYVFKEAYESSSALSHEFLKTNKSFDYKLMLSFLVAAVCLSLFSYFGDLDFARQSLQNWGLNSIANALSKLSQTANDPYLFTLRFWSYSSLVCYFLIPAAFIKLVLKQSLKTYGLSFRSFLEDWKIYLTIYVFMFFAMFAASFLPSFQTLYPYYDPEPLFPNFLIWQLHYIGVFFATEFFFRGFLIHGFKQRFGFYSVFIAMLPYCMVHFGKPIEETLGSIVAGIVLGALSLKTKSIWLGVFIHYSIGLTMDLLALWQQGFL